MKTTRSASSDSSTSTESSTSSSALRNTGATFTTKEVKQKLTATKPETPAVRTRTVAETPTTTSTSSTVPEKKPFQSRFLPNHQQEKKQETESSSEEETSSEESEEEEEEKTPAKTPAKDSALKTEIGPLLARSSNAREAQSDSTRPTSKDESSSRGGYSSPTSYSRGYERETSPKYTRTRPTRDQYEEPKYGSSTTGTSG